MADCSVAGRSIVRGKLLAKRRGAWRCYLDEIAGDAALKIGSVVTITWLGVSCTGRVLRSGAADTTVDALIVGGRADHAELLPAAMYDYQLPMSMVLGYILKDGGEQQSATIDAALLSKTLQRYVRRAGTLGDQLDQLADTLGATWRILLDGLVWIGIDLWTAAAPFDHVLSEGWAPSSGAVPILPEALGLLPGQLYTGPGGGGPQVSIRVGDILYAITPDSSTATIYALDSRADAGESRLSQALRSVIDEQTAPHFWRQTFGGQVIQQRGDGSLDVKMDHPAFKGAPLTSVGVRVPVPGAKLRVQADDRCDVIFEDGDPLRATATVYIPGNADKPVALKGSKVDVGSLTVTATAMGTFVWTYTDGFGVLKTGVLGDPIELVGKITDDCSPDLSLP